ncbi:DUF5309 domain-containing protein [Mailhella massiliensis]|uniref:DUF5309 domain-containing protein n=1 Tax=Mailhella massiliensis TaxID=1903261 RepID=A0A921DSS2_9BACT|nr:DUF5309 domain-containing protein [Mailhella massiliensis]HJD97247.1 DUF5309 domain-containing protein [Mailhella massiliensis]
MANVVSGQLKDANIKGKPRDLMDAIFNVAPTDTPFLTMCGKSAASQTLHEWQTDTLASPAENSALEGADTAAFSESYTTELSNRTQILRKAINVSGTAQAVKQAGVNRQYAYQMALRTRELKKDVEYALLQNKVARADNGTDGRLMTGLPCWMQANYHGAGTKSDGSAAACAAGTTRVPTEAMLKDLLTDVYNAGGNPDCIMMAPDIRVKMSEVLSGGATKMERAEKKKATAVIDVYVSDFGALKLVPNRVQAFEPFSKTCAFVLDPQYWKVAYLRPFREERLAVTGDSLKGHVLVECTLEARNDASSGVLADLKSA